MSGIKDILVTERNRQTLEEWLQLHLFAEGTFYRAYEQSALLCHQRIRDFKPTHRRMKGIDGTVIFVGFPVQSLENHVPQGVQPVAVSEKHVMLQLPSVPEGAPDSIEAMQQRLEEWKASVPIAEPKPKGEGRGEARGIDDSAGGHAHDDGPVTLTSVARQILAFPLESSSPIECYAFIGELKRRLASLF